MPSSIDTSQIRKRIAGITVLLVVVAISLMTYRFTRLVEDDVVQVLKGKTVAVGQSVAVMVEKSLDYGVPFDKLRGLDRVFAKIKKENPELVYVAISDLKGAIQYGARPEATPAARPGVPWGDQIETVEQGNYYETNVPLHAGGQPAGRLHLGVGRAFVRDSFSTVLYDQLTVVLVTILVILELSGFLLRHLIEVPFYALLDILRIGREHDIFAINADVTGGGVLDATYAKLFQWHKAIQTQEHAAQPVKPSRFSTYILHRNQRLFYVRPPLFLAVFANALSLAFFPAYIATLSRNIPEVFKVPEHVTISLPISAFMLCWALSQPLTGPMSRRFGLKNTTIIGCLILAVGLFATGFAKSLLTLVLCQGFGGIGYGFVFVNATAYVVANTDTSNRAQGMATFLSAFFSGTLCGAAIGGILADHIGYRPIFFLGGAIATGAAIFIKTVMNDLETPAAPALSPAAAATKQGRSSGLARLGMNIQFLALAVFIAIPSKLNLTGLMNFLTPLYLSEQGVSQSTTGRILMSYGLFMIVAAPLVAKVADRVGNRFLFILVGSTLSGGAAAWPYFFPGTMGALVSISMLGLSHAIGVSSALAMVPELCQVEIAQLGAPAVIGIYRLIERAGSVLGPIVAGFLIASHQFEGAYLGVGLITMVGMLGFAAIAHQRPTTAPVPAERRARP